MIFSQLQLCMWLVCLIVVKCFEPLILKKGCRSVAFESLTVFRITNTLHALLQIKHPSRILLYQLRIVHTRLFSVGMLLDLLDQG